MDGGCTCTAVGCDSGLFIDRPIVIAPRDRFTIEMCIDGDCTTATGRPWSPNNIDGTSARVGPGRFVVDVQGNGLDLEWTLDEDADLSGPRRRVSLVVTS